MLVDLAELPQECVYAIVDGSRKLVHVNYSINMVGALPRIWSEVRLAGTTQDLELEILSVTTDIETLKLHTEYWRGWYKFWCFDDLVLHSRKTLQYEVKCLVDRDYDLVEVVLISGRGARKVVGKFKTMDEAEEFKESCYSEDNPYRLPVYSINCRTRQFLLDTSIEKHIITI